MNAREFSSRSHTTEGLLRLIGGAFLGAISLAAFLSFSTVATQNNHSAAKQSDASGARTVLISPRNKDGSPADVSASDLKIKLDGKEAAVSAVKRASDVPLYYWLLVDTSGSEREFLPLERGEISRLLAKVVYTGRDYGTLVSFDQESYLDAEGTDPQALLKAMPGNDARGLTALFDALFSSADRPTDVREDFRIMFLFTDGQDNNSRVTREEALAALLREKIHVYAFGHAEVDERAFMTLKPEKSQTKGPDNLKLIAESTGGSAFFPKQTSDFEKDADHIAADIQSLISVTFTPPALKSTSPVHKLEIECKKRGVTVTAPREYYLPD